MYVQKFYIYTKGLTNLIAKTVTNLTALLTLPLKMDVKYQEHPSWTLSFGTGSQQPV